MAPAHRQPPNSGADRRRGRSRTPRSNNVNSQRTNSHSRQRRITPSVSAPRSRRAVNNSTSTSRTRRSGSRVGNAITPATSQRRSRSVHNSSVEPSSQRRRISLTGSPSGRRLVRNSRVQFSTPSPLRNNSIRDQARIASRSTGLYTNNYGASPDAMAHGYDMQLVNHAAGHSPISHPSPPGDGVQDMDVCEDGDIAEDGPRDCYCNSFCKECYNTNASCEAHPGLYCSGPCGRWFHIKCIGWNAIPDAAGDAKQMSAPWDASRVIPLASQTQSQESGNDAWYCIKCWDKHKLDAAQSGSAKVSSLQWKDLKPRHDSHLSEMALRLGLLFPPSFETVNAKRRFKDKVRPCIASSHPRTLATSQIRNLYLILCLVFPLSILP